jgi:hypothetical protein
MHEDLGETVVGVSSGVVASVGDVIEGSKPLPVHFGTAISR